jgi:opacity protein-like surface antigen
MSWGATTRFRGGPVLGAEGRTWGFGSVGLTHLRDAGVEGEDHADGWLIGIGASRLLRDNVILTGEISHTRFSGGSDAHSTGASVGVSFRF